MGYRSEVSLTIKNKDFDTLKSQIMSNEECSYLLAGTAQVYQSDKYTTIHWDWIKWYADYEGIRIIEDFMVEDISYIFHRFGEDDSDYEHRENHIDDEDYDMYEMVSPIRVLQIEFGDRVEISKGAENENV